jgi:hypothetical protein
MVDIFNSTRFYLVYIHNFSTFKEIDLTESSGDVFWRHQKRSMWGPHHMVPIWLSPCSDLSGRGRCGEVHTKTLCGQFFTKENGHFSSLGLNSQKPLYILFKANSSLAAPPPHLLLCSCAGPIRWGFLFPTLQACSLNLGHFCCHMEWCSCQLVFCEIAHRLLGWSFVLNADPEKFLSYNYGRLPAVSLTQLHAFQGPQTLVWAESLLFFLNLLELSGNFCLFWWHANTPGNWWAW